MCAFPNPRIGMLSPTSKDSRLKTSLCSVANSPATPLLPTVLVSTSEFQGPWPGLLRFRKGLPNSETEKSSIFEAEIGDGECSLIPFRAEYLRIRQENAESRNSPYKLLIINTLLRASRHSNSRYSFSGPFSNSLRDSSSPGTNFFPNIVSYSRSVTVEEPTSG